MSLDLVCEKNEHLFAIHTYIKNADGASLGGKP